MRVLFAKQVAFPRYGCYAGRTSSLSTGIRAPFWFSLCMYSYEITYNFIVYRTWLKAMHFALFWLKAIFAIQNVTLENILLNTILFVMLYCKHQNVTNNKKFLVASYFWPYIKKFLVLNVKETFCRILANFVWYE